MDFERDDPILFQERTLIATMISGKPPKKAITMTFTTVLVMALTSQVYWANFWNLSEQLPAVRRLVFEDGELWRVFSAIFIHADFGHFLSNMYMLSIFSFLIYSYFGFLLYPILAIFGSALVNLLAIATYNPDVRLLGASGMVYLLGGFWLTIYFFIQRQYNLFNRWLRVIGIALMIFFPTSFVPTTSYRTHAIGFFLGVALAAFYFLRNRTKIRSYEKYKLSYEEGDPISH